MATRSERARWRRRTIGYPLEAALLYLIYGVFAVLPLDAASALGGWIGRTIGPRLGASRKALRNLEHAMPETTPERRREILRGMWDNLGRVVAEYPHLEEAWQRTEMVGADVIRELAESGKPKLLFSGHIGNWELTPMGATRHGMPVTSVYRRPNNPAVARLIDHVRAVTGSQYSPKGRDGAREIMATLKQNGGVCIMIDQKMNDGIPVPFFGMDAMTAPAIAQLALKFDCPIVPGCIERLGGARFRLTVYPPLELPLTGNREEDIRLIMTRINATVEEWVRARPEQWLWLHRRWPS
jgi:KDO2-lipid IV(A) lauroyltransferase